MCLTWAEILDQLQRRLDLFFLFNPFEGRLVPLILNDIREVQSLAVLAARGI